MPGLIRKKIAPVRSATVSIASMSPIQASSSFTRTTGPS